MCYDWEDEIRDEARKHAREARAAEELRNSMTKKRKKPKKKSKPVHWQQESGKVYCGIKGSHTFTWSLIDVTCKRCRARMNTFCKACSDGLPKNIGYHACLADKKTMRDADVRALIEEK